MHFNSNRLSGRKDGMLGKPVQIVHIYIYIYIYI